VGDEARPHCVAQGLAEHGVDVPDGAPVQVLGHEVLKEHVAEHGPHVAADDVAVPGDRARSQPSHADARPVGRTSSGGVRGGLMIAASGVWRSRGPRRLMLLVGAVAGDRQLRATTVERLGG
jgi:hypothetical protein